MIVMGIDSSTTSTGYCILDNEANKIISVGCIKPNKKLSTIERIIYIEKELKAVWKQYEPEYILIEELVTFRNSNVSRILIGLIQHLVIEFTKYNALIVLVRPTEWRKGKLKSKYREDLKLESKEYVKNKYEIEVNDDESDAVLISEFKVEVL